MEIPMREFPGHWLRKIEDPGQPGDRQSILTNLRIPGMVPYNSKNSNASVYFIPSRIY